LLSGFLVDRDESPIDILIVGDRLKENLIKNAISILEAEFGREIRYMVLETEEYNYRKRVRDKFIRDITDFRNKKITDKLHK
jgi:hypothetical protein